MSLDINNYKKTKGVALGSQWSIGDKKWFKWLGDFIEDIKAYVAQYVADNAGGELPYKVYVALLDQTGTNAPTATVLENTLGFDITWVRTNFGRYTSVEDFAYNKTVSFIGGADGNNTYPESAYRTIGGFGNKLQITTKNPNSGSFEDDFLGKTPIEVRVYQ